MSAAAGKSAKRTCCGNDCRVPAARELGGEPHTRNERPFEVRTPTLPLLLLLLLLLLFLLLLPWVVVGCSAATSVACDNSEVVSCCGCADAGTGAVRGGGVPAGRSGVTVRGGVAETERCGVDDRVPPDVVTSRGR